MGKRDPAGARKIADWPWPIVLIVTGIVLLILPNSACPNYPQVVSWFCFILSLIGGIGFVAIVSGIIWLALPLILRRVGHSSSK